MIEQLWALTTTATFYFLLGLIAASVAKKVVERLRR